MRPTRRLAGNVARLAGCRSGRARIGDDAGGRAPTSAHERGKDGDRPLRVGLAAARCLARRLRALRARGRSRRRRAPYDHHLLPHAPHHGRRPASGRRAVGLYRADRSHRPGRLRKGARRGRKGSHRRTLRKIPRSRLHDVDLDRAYRAVILIPGDVDLWLCLPKPNRQARWG